MVAEDPRDGAEVALLRGVAVEEGPVRTLDRVDLFEQGDGLADLLQVGGAAVAGVQVIVDAGSPTWRQVSVEVVTDEPDEVAAGQVVDLSPAGVEG